MPTYLFLDDNTGEVTEEFMMISEMEKYLKDNKHISLMPAAPAIVGGVGETDSKIDTGMKEVFQKNAEKHPTSPLADRYGNNEKVSRKKSREIVNKHRKNKI